MSIETFKIVQTGSPSRRHWKQRQTLIGLVLNRIGRVAGVPNTRATWGMIEKVRHLVQVVDEALFEEHRVPDRHEKPLRIGKGVGLPPFSSGAMSVSGSEADSLLHFVPYYFANSLRTLHTRFTPQRPPIPW